MSSCSQQFIDTFIYAFNCEMFNSQSWAVFKNKIVFKYISVFIHFYVFKYSTYILFVSLNTLSGEE